MSMIKLLREGSWWLTSKSDANAAGTVVKRGSQASGILGMEELT